jgi:hypothetical protein
VKGIIKLNKRVTIGVKEKKILITFSSKNNGRLFSNIQIVIFNVQEHNTAGIAAI